MFNKVLTAYTIVYNILNITEIRFSKSVFWESLRWGRIDQNKTVVKSREIINLFLECEKLSVNQMVEHLHQPRTSVYRMVRSLEEMGFLSKTEDGRYILGLILLQLGQLVKDRLDVRKVVLPIMKKLQVEVDEAVNLIVRDQNEAVYIEKVDTTHPVRVYNEHLGRRMPLYAGACPRILLTYMPEVEQARYLKEVDLQPVGRGTITNLLHLQTVIREDRVNGYTVSHSELLDDTSAVAAPIFNHVGEIIAGISVAGLTSRFTPETLPKLIRSVCEATARCSALLGYKAQHEESKRELSWI